MSDSNKADQRPPIEAGSEAGRKLISIVIPILNAEKYLPALMDKFFSQKPFAPDEVLLVDSGSTDRSIELAKTYHKTRVVSIAKFSHGASRNLGLREARGDIVVFMSQDALPKDEAWLVALIEPFRDETVAAAYSRQIPYPGAPPTEQFFLEYHFPPGEPTRRAKRAGEELSFQKVFFSNVSSALRKSIAQRFPFDETLIMSEDQQFARDAVAGGFTLVYQPSSVVFHSHNYTLKTVFRRYFDSVYSITQIFPSHGVATSARIGLRYLVREAAHIFKRHPRYLPYYFAYVAAKAGGTITGHMAKKLPSRMAERLSMHRYYWKMDG